MIPLDSFNSGTPIAVTWRTPLCTRLSEKVSGAVEIRDVPDNICTSRVRPSESCENLPILDGIQIDIIFLEYLSPSFASYFVQTASPRISTWARAFADCFSRLMSFTDFDIEGTDFH